jgi:hypothetical protein
MHLEVERACELCLRGFTVSYDFVGERMPCSRDTLAERLIPCPRCGHANRIHMLPYAGNIVSRRTEHALVPTPLLKMA